MFKVLKVDGPNIMTDKGGVCIAPFQYADGGKSHGVGEEDWRKMRDLFIAAPEMRAALLYIEQFDGAALSKEQVATICKRASAAIAKADGK